MTPRPTRRLRTLMICLALLAGPASARAEDPHSGVGDPRLKVVTYDPSAVVSVRGVLGYQMVIEFDPGEKIENVAIGDSVGWQVVPSHRANLLFLKPMERAPPTNMAVITNLRRYAFALSIGSRRARARDLIYSLRFEYPTPATVSVEAVAPVPPQDVNHAYSYEGSPAIIPSRLFDDGHATYFQFRDGEAYPAIFTLDADKGEAVVNSSIHDGYIVIDRLARGFVLRRGKDVARIFNDGYQAVGPGPLSPQPRRKSLWPGP
jgi:type IV secretion system protein VirB9